MSLTKIDLFKRKEKKKKGTIVMNKKNYVR